MAEEGQVTTHFNKLGYSKEQTQRGPGYAVLQIEKSTPTLRLIGQGPFLCSLVWHCGTQSCDCLVFVLNL